MGGVANSRIFGYTLDYTDFDDGYPDDLANLHYVNYLSMGSCDDDRREWISSVDAYLEYEQNNMQPTQFTLKARNSNLEEWTTLRTVTA